MTATANPWRAAAELCRARVLSLEQTMRDQKFTHYEDRMVMIARINEAIHLGNMFERMAPPENT